MRFLLLSSFFCLCYHSIVCKHIAGAEFFYTCLGNHTYEVTLRFYRDCKDPDGADFDRIIYLYIFNSRGQVHLIREIPRPMHTNVTPNQLGACLSGTISLCQELAIYKTTVSLPPVIGGYNIAWQRCCRNEAIINLSNPGDAGITFLAHVPGSDELPDGSCNSMPRFNGRPPIFVCANRLFQYQMAATDPDGDSLVYRITNPYNSQDINGFGANANTPVVGPLTGGGYVPLRPPPYNPVSFARGFSYDKPFGNGGIFSIDPFTGLLSIQPTGIGVYVVCFSVFEYRNGKLLSENKFDLQFYALGCIDFGAPPVIAHNFNNTDPGIVRTRGLIDTLIAKAGDNICYTITLTQQAPGTKTLKRIWPITNLNIEVNYRSQTNTETVAEVCLKTECTDPPRAFPIIFVGYNTQDCENYNQVFDTVFVKIRPSPALDFTLLQQPCSRQIEVSTDFADYQQLRWEIGDTAVIGSKRVSYTFAQPGEYRVRLINPDGSGCNALREQVVRAPKIPNVSVSYQSRVCDPEVQFNTVGTEITQYRWSFGDGTESSDAQPVHRYTLPGNYTVSLVVIGDTGCVQQWSAQIPISIRIPAEIIAPAISCDSVVNFSSAAPAGLAVQWDFGNGIRSSEANPRVTFERNRRYTIRFITNPGDACADSASHEIFIPEITPAVFEYAVDNCEKSITLRSPSNAELFWELGDGQNRSGVSEFVYRYNQAGEYTVRLITNPQALCPDTMEKKIRVGFIDPLAFSIPDTVCNPIIQPANLSTPTPNILWRLSTGDTSTARQPIFSLPDTGRYELWLIIEPGRICADSIRQIVNYTLPPAADFSFRQIDFCSGTYEFIDNSYNARSHYWRFGNGSVGRGSIATSNFLAAGDYRVSLIVSGPGGCTDTIEKVLNYEGAPGLFIHRPNAFTPNGDGQNEVWQVLGKGRNCLERLTIFDRWGAVVFQTQDFEKGWDGTSGNKKCSEGVYVYVLTGKSLRITGTITLTR